MAPSKPRPVRSGSHATGCPVPSGAACPVDCVMSLRGGVLLFFRGNVHGTTYPGFGLYLADALGYLLQKEVGCCGLSVTPWRGATVLF